MSHSNLMKTKPIAQFKDIIKNCKIVRHLYKKLKSNNIFFFCVHSEERHRWNCSTSNGCQHRSSWTTTVWSTSFWTTTCIRSTIVNNSTDNQAVLYSQSRIQHIRQLNTCVLRLLSQKLNVYYMYRYCIVWIYLINLQTFQFYSRKKKYGNIILLIPAFNS